MRCDERSTGHVPFRCRCVTLRWTLLVRRRYRPTSDTSRVTIRDMVSLLDCRSITIIVVVVVSVLLYVKTRAVQSTSPSSSPTRRIYLMASKNKHLKEVNFDLKRVSSYGGVDALRRITRVPRKIVEEWLSEQDAYTLHKSARCHFRRRRVVVGGPHEQWQADLVDLLNLKTDNDGMTTVIDFFTKVAWCVPLKNKSAASLVTALKSTFNEGWPLWPLQTDQGLEFLNRSVQALLKKYGIHHFSTHNTETKASIVEIFNRTLKRRMWRYFTKHQAWRYIDVLRDFVQSYNHRSNGMIPSQVNAKNQE